MVGSRTSNQVQSTRAEKRVRRSESRKMSEDREVVKEWLDGVNEWRGLGMGRGVRVPRDKWWEERAKTRSVSRGLGCWEKERDELDEGKLVEQRSTLVPVRGTRKRTSSWYIIDQRLIMSGVGKVVKERLWDNQRELWWVGRGKRNKRGPDDGAASDPGV
jgi:hypothetical protein